MINIHNHCIFLKYGDVKNYKQLLDEVLMIILFKIIKVELEVISQSRRLRLITLTKTLIILDITKTESNSKCFSNLYIEQNKNGKLMASNTKHVNLTELPLEIMHWRYT